MDEAYYLFYQSAMILSLIASSIVLVLMWQHRKANGSHAMIAMAIATFIWTLGYFLESHSNTLERQLMFTTIGYCGTLSVPIAWFVFSINYTGEKRIVTGWKSAALSLIPFTFFILIATNSIHHLMWSGEHLTTSGAFTITKKTYEPAFWAMIAWDYLVVIAGSIVLLRRLFVGSHLFTRQAISLIIAASLPLIWNVIYIFDLLDLPRKDLTPVTFAVSGLVIAYGLMRLRLFSAVPFARRFIIKQLRDGILVFDAKNRLIEINPMAETVLALSPEAIGMTADQLNVKLPILEMMVSTGFAGAEVPLNVRGEERIYEVETVPMRTGNDDKVGNLVIMHDITERKDMQEQLIAQDRLASIGELTSGVAHEINNPLAVIKGFVELLMQRDFPEDVMADIIIVNSEVDRATKIVSNLLTFSRKQPEEKSPVDVNDIIEKTIELRAYEQTSNNIRTVLHLASDLPRVMGSELQLRQVFLNLVINAEFFMKQAHNSGILEITTERAGNFIRIFCKDDGPGIPQENIKRLFNPFFTTKEVGKGTGLGLSICHGIITEHGGNIWAESAPGEGATFVIVLPVYKRAEQQSADNGRSSSAG